MTLSVGKGAAGIGGIEGGPHQSLEFGEGGQAGIEDGQRDGSDGRRMRFQGCRRRGIRVRLKYATGEWKNVMGLSPLDQRVLAQVGDEFQDVGLVGNNNPVDALGGITVDDGAPDPAQELADGFIGAAGFEPDQEFTFDETGDALVMLDGGRFQG
jgi:hypothetical protein